MNEILDCIGMEDKVINHIGTFHINGNRIELKTINDVLQKRISMPCGFTIVCTSIEEGLSDNRNRMYDVSVYNQKNNPVDLRLLNIDNNMMTSFQIDESIIKKLSFLEALV